MTFIHPKTAHRFRVSFDGFGLGQDSHATVLSEQVERVERPNLSIDANGISTHTPFRIVLRDEETNIVTQNVMHQFRVGTVFAVTIDVMDPRCERVVEHIVSDRCRLVGVEHSPLRYDTANPSTITLVIDPEQVFHRTFERVTVRLRDGKPAA